MKRATDKADYEETVNPGGGSGNSGNTGGSGSSGNTGSYGSSDDSDDTVYDDERGSWQKDEIGWWYWYVSGGYAADKWAQINGKWYYFKPDGYMATGWQLIGGKYYYLSESAGEPTYTYDEALRKWVYKGKARPYGSMYANETTSDGHKVDASGARIQ